MRQQDSGSAVMLRALAIGEFLGCFLSLRNALASIELSARITQSSMLLLTPMAEQCTIIQPSSITHHNGHHQLHQYRWIPFFIQAVLFFVWRIMWGAHGPVVTGRISGVAGLLAQGSLEQNPASLLEQIEAELGTNGTEVVPALATPDLVAS
eukprot:2765948-Amphidinium_carterae.1